MKKENFKIINYDGKQIQLRKFNPLDGCYIIQMVLTSFFPDMVEAQLGIQRPMKPNKVMSKEEFNDLMLDCMGYVSYLQKDPVECAVTILNDNGSIGHPDFDTNDVFMLTLEVLIYNLSGFFTQKNMERLQNLFVNAVSGFTGMTTSEVQSTAQSLTT